MIGEHRYSVTARWTGDRGTGTSGYRDYDRSVTLHADGRPDLEASSDRAFRGDASRWNPEDMLLAALAQCHLLSYLHACVRAGVVVRGYRDEATAVMREDGRGGGAFVEAVLRPTVEVADAAMAAAALAAHEQAHQWCFIAASVSFPVRIEPTVAITP